jgi:predicted nucleic acid-binding protein
MSAGLLVADSGPLIALARLDLLDLPGRYFESVLVTSTVWEEVTRKPGVDERPRLSAAVDAKVIQVAAEPETIPDTLIRTTIDAGERGAIALGIELNATPLIDDRLARRVAIELRRPVVGTLALLLRAREEGLVTALRPLTERLQASGYYLPGQLVADVLSLLGE